MNIKDQLPLLQWAEESKMSVKHFLEWLERLGYQEPHSLITMHNLIKVFMDLENPGPFLKYALPKITGLHFDRKDGTWKKSRQEVKSEGKRKG